MIAIGSEFYQMTIETPVFFGQTGSWHIGAPVTFAFSELAATVFAQERFELREAKSPSLVVTVQPPALEVAGFVYVADVAEYAFLNAPKSDAARQAAVKLIIAALSDKELMLEFFGNLEKLMETEEDRAPEIYEILEGALAILYKSGESRFRTLLESAGTSADFTAAAHGRKLRTDLLEKIAEDLLEVASPKFLKGLFTRYNRDGIHGEDDVKRAGSFVEMIGPALPPEIESVLVGRPHTQYIIFTRDEWMQQHTQPAGGDNIAAMDLNKIDMKYRTVNPNGSISTPTSYKTERSTGTAEMVKTSHQILRRLGIGS